MIAVGVSAGALLARRYARDRLLDPDALFGAILVLVVGGIVGARALWLLEQGSDTFLDPAEWLGTRGYSFYGAILVGVPAAVVYLHLRGGRLRHLDALAAGFPLGMAVGRIGDVINGEHYGPASDLPWAFRYTHPDAEVPSAAVAYHSGGFYELLLGLALLAFFWPVRHRFARPGALFLAVVATYAAGRFLIFFWREDSETLALGLVSAQWTSLALIGAAAIAWAVLRRLRVRALPEPSG
jgi:phosphatidylglycerol:prolipoprotein diacylglycerol transferase